MAEDHKYKISKMDKKNDNKRGCSTKISYYTIYQEKGTLFGKS